MNGTALVRYDAMCRAIADAHGVDEVKDVRDKALALQIYARQARNVEAECQACEIRLRAERRAGQMLRQMQKAQGARKPGTNRGTTRSHDLTASQTLDKLGISKGQAARWQKLAQVPPDLFEQEVKSRDKRPTTNGIISTHAPKQEPIDAVDPNALWLWGRLKDFQRDGLLDLDPSSVLGTMLPHMQKTTMELAPLVAAWLRRIK